MDVHKLSRQLMLLLRAHTHTSCVNHQIPLLGGTTSQTVRSVRGIFLWFLITYLMRMVMLE